MAEKSLKEGEMVWRDYEMKPFEETDIELRITHCGVCATDNHVAKNGWVSLATTIPGQDADNAGHHFVPNRRWARDCRCSYTRRLES